MHNKFTIVVLTCDEIKFYGQSKSTVCYYEIFTESKLTLNSCLRFYYYGIIFDPIKGFGRVGYKLKHTVVALNASDVHMI